MFTNKLLAIAAAGVLAAAGLAQAQEKIEVTFDETSPGTWDVLAEVTTEGNSGISSYSVSVVNTPASEISYSQNNLSALSTEGTGFGSANKGPVPVDDPNATTYNAGSFQTSASDGFLNVGKEPVHVEDLGGGPAVDLGVPALFGTFTTPTGLGAENFEASGWALFNAAGDGFLSSSPEISTTVDPIPEPTSLALLGLGGVALFTRRRRA